MPTSRVVLPRGVRGPYEVYVNGVRQAAGTDYVERDRTLVFEADMRQEGRLGFWRWALGAFGVGTYRQDDQVDVAWEVDGRPRVAHALPIERDEEPPGS